MSSQALKIFFSRHVEGHVKEIVSEAKYAGHNLLQIIGIAFTAMHFFNCIAAL